MAEYAEIDYEVENQICTITISSPTRNNAYTPHMANELISAAQRADADPDVRVVVLTGRGRFFCPGAYLGDDSTFVFDESEDGWGASGTVDGYRRDGGGRVALAFAAMRKPIISAINGAAVGVGSTMLLPTDIRIAATTARFGFVFVRRGLVPEATSSWFLPRVVGINRALEWVYTGRIIDADEALASGLVSRVVAPEDLMSTAYELAGSILQAGSAVALGASRQLLWGMLTADSPWEAHRLDSRYVVEYGKREDVREGVRSFLEKRQPEFALRVPTDYPDFIPWFPDKNRIQ